MAKKRGKLQRNYYIASGLYPSETEMNSMKGGFINEEVTNYSFYCNNIGSYSYC